MKKNVSIEKNINFSSMIGEISAISLEHDLKFVSNDEINGNLIVSGKYKSTSASQIEEEFNEKIPVSISLLEKVDMNNAKVDIADFYYNIVDNESLKCNIEVLVDALELIDEDRSSNCPLEDERECDGDPISEKEIEIPKIEKTDFKEEKEIASNVENIEERTDDKKMGNLSEEENKIDNEDIETLEINEEVDNDNENIFFNFDSSKETYGTFIVYMVRQNETINTILEKYKTTLEEVEKYNDIKDISIGSKLIIPLINEKD